MQYVLKWVFLACIFSSTTTMANDAQWKYSLGLSFSQLSLDVYEKGKTDPEGILTDDFLIMPLFGIESNVKNLYYGGWGYRYVFNLGPFKMKTQEVDLEDVDLGTSAKGYFAYAMPVLVYDFLGDKVDSSLVVGLGVGIGFLEARGDIIFTEANPQTRHNFKFSEMTYAYGLFFEHEFNDFSYGFSLYGPEVIKGDYEYNLFNFELVFRKKYYF